ncbi:hypothetical protein SAMN04488595_107191 [Ralstonia sp. 25mfcol4.1]|uniref:hypothetical protein n=1 Tax=Burkholderiaceae TaxID=119060 RepID=UPI000885655E|nr:hypothetical protein [Ralstonia sp. 25mfcol4.1]SDP33789.1 hypothetical protein SAMN04488595_107191 [Ralstonia sp. 25mfcol4.1]
MDRMRYSDEDLEAQRQQALLEREIFPVDHRIQRLRSEIRARLRHLRNLKQKGYPVAHAERLLGLMCRTLAVDRAYRRAMLKAIRGRIR